MRVERLDQITQPGVGAWNDLARGVPFRRYEWLSTWWSHYGERREEADSQSELFLLAFYDRDELVGLAPWYMQRSLTAGRVLRFLGTGEVYSDYLSVLCRPEHELQISEALVEWLGHEGADSWDAVDLSGTDDQDRMVNRVLDEFEANHFAIHFTQGLNCWRVPLPSSWDEYSAQFSKNTRKRMRRMQRELLESGRARLCTADSLPRLQQALETLIALHQKRWNQLGQPGSFASKRFAAFLPRAVTALYAAGMVELHWLELDQQPLAAELNFVGRETIYSYLAGIDPDAIEHNPGHLLTMAVLQDAIGRRFRFYDLLRGNEPYKSRWKAVSRPTLEARIAARGTAAQLRHNVWLAGTGAKQLIKSSMSKLTSN